MRVGLDGVNITLEIKGDPFATRDYKPLIPALSKVKNMVDKLYIVDKPYVFAGERIRSAYMKDGTIKSKTMDRGIVWKVGTNMVTASRIIENLNRLNDEVTWKKGNYQPREPFEIEQYEYMLAIILPPEGKSIYIPYDHQVFDESKKFIKDYFSKVTEILFRKKL